MIYPSKYNGINFSYDFSRESNTFNFDNQRKKNIINSDNDVKYLSFFIDTLAEGVVNTLEIISKLGKETLIPENAIKLTNGWIYFYSILEVYTIPEEVYFKLTIGDDIIYSEIVDFKTNQFLTQNEICQITAYNNDSRHGYLTKTFPAFGFFKFSKLNSDFFINSKVEYEYSYGRKMILSSENNIGKRFTFLNLTMYQQNLLKWLCNTENLFIDGVKYQLISDFTELLADENSEIKDLRADFIPVEQSFFGQASTSLPKNIFTDQFFM